MLYSPGPRHHILHLHLYSLNWLWQSTQAWLKNTLLLVNTSWETHVLNMGNQASPLAIRMGSHVQLTFSQHLFKAWHSELHVSHILLLSRLMCWISSGRQRLMWCKMQHPIHKPFSLCKMKAVQTGVFWGVKNQLRKWKKHFWAWDVFWGWLSLLAELSPPSHYPPHTVDTAPCQCQHLCWVH